MWYTKRSMTAFERQIEAARGWLVLNAPLEAERELAEIEPKMRSDLRLLELRADIYEACCAWDQLHIIALMLCEARPKEAQWPRAFARATRHCRSAQAALAVLMDAAVRFPEAAVIRYDLACCEAVTGNLNLARINLAEAIRLEPQFWKLAGVDADLVALHAEMDDFRPESENI